MALVLRLETEYGAGPYYMDGREGRSKAKRIIGEFYTYSTETHPGPEFDPLLSEFWTECSCKEQKVYKFGFSSLKQYKTWFHTKSHRVLFASAGLILARYKVHKDYLIRGERQVIFHMDHAELVESLSPDYV